MPKKSLFLTIIISLLLSVNIARAGSFSDVPENSPYYLSIENLKSLNIIKGYADGTFKPDQLVNRAEALKLILTSNGFTSGNGLFNTGFKDVFIDSWFAGYVMEGTLREIIQGNPDGMFAPERNVNTAEFIKMLCKTFNVNLANYQYPTTSGAKDVKPEDWFAPYLAYAKNNNIIYQNVKNELEPGRKLTRAECAEIIFKMLILGNGGETQKMLSMAEAKLIDSVVQIKNGNIQNALNNANDAVFYTETAIQQQPESSMTRAANGIAQSFQKLYFGYQAGVEQKKDDLKKLVAEAKKLALEAVKIDVSLKPLADNIDQLSEFLLQQI